MTKLIGGLTDYKEGKPGEILLNCPFCLTKIGKPDTGYHLNVSTIKRVYHCYRCKASGNISALFDDFGSHFFTPQERIGIFELIDDILGSIQVPERRDIDLDEISVPMFKGSQACQYLLQDRSLPLSALDWYKIRIGIGQYRNRIIIPTFDISGTPTYFVARAYDDAEPRYRNPKMPKAGTVFNANAHVAMNPYVTIMCEGVFSAIHAGLKGWNFLSETFEDAILPSRCSMAIFGSYLQKEQARVISGRVGSVYICLDSDRTWKEKKEMARMLRKLGCETYVLTLPEPKPEENRKKNDPETISYEDFEKCLREAVVV